MELVCIAEMVLVSDVVAKVLGQGIVRATVNYIIPVIVAYKGHGGIFLEIKPCKKGRSVHRKAFVIEGFSLTSN